VAVTLDASQVVGALTLKAAAGVGHFKLTDASSSLKAIGVTFIDGRVSSRPCGGGLCCCLCLGWEGVGELTDVYALDAWPL
jgi:hypothetical protein